MIKSTRTTSVSHGGRQKFVQGVPAAYLVTHPTPHGTKEIEIPLGDADRYKQDPIQFLAAYYGISTREYLEWHESGYCVHCSGMTKAGQRCKALAMGGYAVADPVQWVRLRRNSYCYWHSEAHKKHLAQQPPKRLTVREFADLLGITYQDMRRAMTLEEFAQLIPKRTVGGELYGLKEYWYGSKEYWSRPLVEQWWNELPAETKDLLHSYCRSVSVMHEGQ